MEWLASVDTLY